MKRGIAIALGLAALVAAGAGGFVVAARQGWLKPDVAAMRARYGLPNSRFETIAGQPHHYVDEGQGPAIILVHGSFASLRMWDGWAAALRKHYRVVRFDRPRMGLSGPSPDGRVDGEAESRMIGALADRLGLARFAVVGTSSSGESVAHYAAIHPERVSAVILANIAAHPIAPAPLHGPWWFRAALAVDPWLGGWHLPALWRGVLLQNYADKSKVTPELVTEWTQLNNLAQGMPRAPRPDHKPSFSGTPADLAAIRAPTLLLWSDRDPEVPLETHGRDALRSLGTSDKQLRVLSNCGHMMPAECSAQSVALAEPFFGRVLPPGR